MKYSITGAGFDAETRSEKASAITRATALAKEHKATVEVATEAGTVVHTAKARKAQKSTPRFTRLDVREIVLGDGIKLPKGWDVAYARPRTSLVLLRKVTQGADGFDVDYKVFDATNGGNVVVGTTREAGSIFSQIRKGELELVV